MTVEEFKNWFYNLSVYDEIPEEVIHKLKKDKKTTNGELEKYLSQKINNLHIECELIEKRKYFIDPEYYKILN